VPTQIPSLLRSATRRPGGRLSLLSVRSGDDAFDARLARALGFCDLLCPDARPWDPSQAPQPDNLALVPAGRVPAGVAFDLVLACFQADTFAAAIQVSGGLHAPLVCLFREPPPAPLTDAEAAELAALPVSLTVALGHPVARAWRLGGDAVVVARNDFKAVAQAVRAFADTNPVFSLK
jgi:hypothetical protein